jgi:hypothetical protein
MASLAKFFRQAEVMGEIELDEAARIPPVLHYLEVGLRRHDYQHAKYDRRQQASKYNTSCFVID